MAEAIELLSELAEQMLKPHNFEALGEGRDEYVRGLFTAIGYLLDPPEAGMSVIDTYAYAFAGLAYMESRHA